MPGSERGMGETAMRNHWIGALVPTLRDPQPSQEDRTLTTRLTDAGKVLGIELLDHLILGDARYYSFKEAGGL